ncbi:hypothetical protein V6N11_048086 [Hibiscus sabdariffa]|uniref:Uncharacterized protein n=1 Tax=Hibiscus sabdariffa TaxID=183260 RepID=A0ABR2NRP4_9ROSI
MSCSRQPKLAIVCLQQGMIFKINNRQPAITLHLEPAITPIETARDNFIVNQRPTVVTEERLNLVNSEVSKYRISTGNLLIQINICQFHVAVETTSNCHSNFDCRNTNRNSQELIGRYPSINKSGKGSFRFVVEG